MLALLLVSGCASSPKPPPEPELVPVAPENKVAITPTQLAQWLEAAQQALERDQLTYPEATSAQSHYQRILQLDPTQEDALRGLERIVEIYVARAMQALSRRQFASARSMLARARIILPNHPSIEPSAEQIRLIMTADRQIMKLSQPDLNAASKPLQDALGAFAQTAENTQCRFQISAKNDTQGRWIYQTMSKGLTSGRLRAQIDIRLPASVERLCFSP